MLNDDKYNANDIYKEIRALMDFTTLENIRKYDIIEKRYNDGSHYTKDEHGRFTGSTSSGGGGSASGEGVELWIGVILMTFFLTVIKKLFLK